jgi:enoyl-CoA hydratase/carnithine racemase
VSDEGPARYEVADGICTITMDAPERRNALDAAMLAALPEAFSRAHADESVAVVVLTGAGTAFCAGGDLKAMAADLTPGQRKADFTDRVHGLARVLERFDKPVVAMLNGAAVGAGLDIALMCDLRIAAETARLSAGYIDVGLVPGNGAAFLLPRLIGLASALDLLLTGRTVTGREAADLGLVNRAVPVEALHAETRALARELAGKPRFAMRMMKRLVYQSLDTTLSVALELASSQVAILQSSPEHRDAVAAFADGRRVAGPRGSGTADR